MNGQGYVALRRPDAYDKYLDETIVLTNDDNSSHAPFYRSRAASLQDWKESRSNQTSRAGIAKPENKADEQQALNLLR